MDSMFVDDGLSAQKENFQDISRRNPLPSHLRDHPFPPPRRHAEKRGGAEERSRCEGKDVQRLDEKKGSDGEVCGLENQSESDGRDAVAWDRPEVLWKD
jgi:hypothetical protein